MSFNSTPVRLESAFIQRNASNSLYDQINVSGSDLIFYHDSNGIFTADRISVWAALYGIGSGGSGVTPGGSYNISASYASASLSSSYALTASYVYFNGNRVITRNDPDFEGLNVGGVSTVEFLNNFFFPFAPATITLDSIGTQYRETGSTQNITLTGNITANSETIFGSTGSIFRDSVFYSNFPSASSYSDSDIVIGSVGVTGHTYKTYMGVGNNGTPALISSSTRTLTFIFPYLYGTSTSPGLSGNALYTAMTKNVATQGTKTVNMSGTTVYMYYCFPDSYSILTSVKDPSLFEIFSAFEYSSSVPVTSSGLTVNWMNNYKVYRTTLQSDPNGNYIFTH